MKLQVRELSEKDESAFFNGMKDWEGESLHWYTFAWKEGMSFLEMLEILRKDRLGIDLPPDRVPHTMLYGFVDGNIIGRVSVRHELNENLLKRGGHIGYAVAKNFRQKGFATELARAGLSYCRSLGVMRVLVTCADTNVASWRIIEKLNGHLENSIWDEEEKETIRRYWIDL